MTQCVDVYYHYQVILFSLFFWEFWYFKLNNNEQFVSTTPHKLQHRNLKQYVGI